jgi:hypothetical protein
LGRSPAVLWQKRIFIRDCGTGHDPATVFIFEEERWGASMFWEQTTSNILISSEHILSIWVSTVNVHRIQKAVVQDLGIVFLRSRIMLLIA